jgi:hypothetical protein
VLVPGFELPERLPAINGLIAVSAAAAIMNQPVGVRRDVPQRGMTCVWADLVYPILAERDILLVEGEP